MKIALLGYGKMGQAIENEALNAGHQVVLKIDSTNQSMLTITTLKQADVAIEFSRPEVAFRNIMLCLDAQVPVISGTTGWLENIDKVKEHCKQVKGAFLYASNFSIGVNLFFQLNKLLTKLMKQHPQYVPQMEEIHHIQKLDAPSGTAISLANDLLALHPGKSSWALYPAIGDQVLAIDAKRIDKVPGTHAISWSSVVDTIEIKHTAHSRKGFVLGALMAAEWLIGREGCFGMEDVLESA